MGLFDWLGTSTQSQNSQSGIKVAAETDLEKQATSGLSQNLTGLQDLVGAGANQSDVTAGAQGNRDLAALLQQYSSPQGLVQAQMGAVQGYTDLGNQIFGGQLRAQNVEAQRQAARTGRQSYDAVFQNKLAQQRSDTVGNFAAQQALQSPFQSMQFATQRAGILDQLSQQAFTNRQTALGYGSQLREQDRAYRINTAEKWNNTQQSQTASPLDTMGALAGIAGTFVGGATGLSAAGQGVGALAGGLGGMMGGGKGGGGGGQQSYLGGSQMASDFGGGPAYGGGGGFGGGMQQFAMKPAAYPSSNSVMQYSGNQNLAPYNPQGQLTRLGW
jgi:hypothetical protein